MLCSVTIIQFFHEANCGFRPREALRPLRCGAETELNRFKLRCHHFSSKSRMWSAPGSSSLFVLYSANQSIRPKPDRLLCAQEKQRRAVAR